MKKIVFTLFFMILLGCAQYSMERDANKFIELAENINFSDGQDFIKGTETLKAFVLSLDGKYKGADLVDFTELVEKKIEQKKARGEDCEKITTALMLISL